MRKKADDWVGVTMYRIGRASSPGRVEGFLSSRRERIGETMLCCRREASGGYGIGGAEEPGKGLARRGSPAHCRRRRGGMR